MRCFCFMFALSFLSVFPTINAQSLKARIAGSYDFHLKQSETVGQYSPYETDVEQPSFASFYNNNAGLHLDLSYRFRSDEYEKGRFFAGFSYERTTSDAKNFEAGMVLGSSLTQNKYTPYIGYGTYIDDYLYYSFVYGIAGITFKNYYGEGVITEGSFKVDAEYNYEKAIALRFGIGIDFENIKDSPVTFGFSVYGDFGSVYRDKIYLYQNGQKIGEGDPTGQTDLYDNTIYVMVSIAYQLNFQND